MAAVERPLIVITGPTASGKSGLALELAERFGGEIVCADSRTVYKSMDIGTAKPTNEEQARVPHHLLDVAQPDARFTVAEFQQLARRAIADIRARGKVPFLVGGSGLYIDAVVLNYTFVTDRGFDDTLLAVSELEERTVDELHMMIKEQQLEMPRNLKNKRHLVNVLRRRGKASSATARPDNSTYVVAITTEAQELNVRIERRIETMFRAGVVDEARRLSQHYGWECEAMLGNIYPIARLVIEGELTRAEAIELAVTRDRQLAKRQITWLKRHDYVKWLRLDAARRYIETVLDEMC